MNDKCKYCDYISKYKIKEYQDLLDILGGSK